MNKFGRPISRTPVMGDRVHVMKNGSLERGTITQVWPSVCAIKMADSTKIEHYHVVLIYDYTWS